jgi:Uma2 family endonuclease
MVSLRHTDVPRPIAYPDSDGQPMADNTLQFQWIVTLKENLDALLPDFVGGDLLWYPVEGEPTTRAAPDVLVALGRPKGHRGSYLQWREDGVAPQVLFEVLSPGNRFGELHRKAAFYERHGAQELYIYDPQRETLEGLVREGDRLVEVEDMHGFTSPRLGIRFFLTDTLHVHDPSGQPFLTFGELKARADDERRRAEEAAARADDERRRAEEATARADDERRRAEEATARADDERRRADEAAARADALAARLRALGVDP